MGVFIYGDPHPVNADLRQRKHEVDTRAARKYVNELSTAAVLYQQAGRNTLEALSRFDLERPSICHWQAWITRKFQADSNNVCVARLLSAYGIAGGPIVSLRLHATEVVRWFEGCLAGTQRLGDDELMMLALNNLGNAWNNLGEARKAMLFYEQAMTTAKELNHRVCEGQALNNLGLACLALGELMSAQAHFESVWKSRSN